MACGTDHCGKLGSKPRLVPGIRGTRYMELTKRDLKRARSGHTAKHDVALDLVYRQHAADGRHRWLKWRTLHELDQRRIALERRQVHIAVSVNVGKSRLRIADGDVLNLTEKILQVARRGLVD